MTVRRCLHWFLALAALSASTLLAGCGSSDAGLAGEDGKPLAQINLAGPPPHQLILLGPDEVRVRQGDSLAISVDGDHDVADSLRFTLKDGALGIMRQDSGWKLPGKAIVNVTMPPPDKLVAAGSGSIRAESLAPRSEITIGGSGDIETLNVATEHLHVTIAGSGSCRAAGTTGRLNVTIAGTGTAAMEALAANQAAVEIVGSGHGTFASDGNVSAKVAGSGAVRVIGSARCTATGGRPDQFICQP